MVRTSKPISRTQVTSEHAEYREFDLPASAGNVTVRFYEAGKARAGVIMVGGVGGDFDSPARNMYPRLAEDLRHTGICTLRVQFRNPIDLERSIEDVLAGVEFLGSQGVQCIALVGHSFGGAVVISAGAASERVKTVVTLATQSHGADQAANLAPRSLLLLHGIEDQVLPPICSLNTYRLAGRPKDLKLLSGAGHCLDEAADDVYMLVHSWLIGHLSKC